MTRFARTPTPDDGWLTGVEQLLTDYQTHHEVPAGAWKGLYFQR